MVKFKLSLILFAVCVLSAEAVVSFECTGVLTGNALTGNLNKLPGNVYLLRANKTTAYCYENRKVMGCCYYTPHASNNEPKGCVEKQSRTDNCQIECRPGGLSGSHYVSDRCKASDDLH